MSGKVFAALLVLAACAAGCLTGCGGGGGGGTASPTISNTRVSPSVWTYIGGVATIRAAVTDTTGMASVKAAITSSAGTANVTMGNIIGSSYAGFYTVPTNTSATGQDMVYSVVISATNTGGKTTSAPPIQFTVPSPDTPPPPPD